MRGRLAHWLVLALLLAPAAAAAPISAKDYVTKAQDEVEYQNFTCDQLEWLDHYLEELRYCAPAAAGFDDPEGDVGRATRDPNDANDLQRFCEEKCLLTRQLSASGKVVQVCSNAHRPTYGMDAATYDETGPILRRVLNQVGIGRLTDTYHTFPGIDENATISAPAARSLLSSVQDPIRTARALKNCHPD